MAAFAWRNQKVLILDSDPDFITWCNGILADGQGADVRATSSAAEAYHLLRAFPARVGLVDVRLPDFDGVDFLRWLRNTATSPLPDMPVVLTAARPAASVLREACQIGIESFMQKPIPEDRFLRRLTATVLQPSRFVIAKDYFGPDRRKQDLPFDPPDRRMAGKAQGDATLRTAPPPPPPQPAAPVPSPAAQVAPTPAPAARPAASPIPAQEPRRKAGDWDGDLADEPAEAVPKVREIPESGFTAPPVAATKDADGWSEALDDGKEALARKAAEELAIDMAPILADHREWLRSGGREGQRAILVKAKLSGADLAGVNLANADLQDVVLANANCRDAIFQGADMRRADLSAIDAINSNMGVARLRHANMSLAQLNGANLRGTDLAGATLRGALLDEADLGGSNLLSTDLRGCDLSGVRGLTQVQIAKARADSTTRLPGGLRLPRKET